MPSSLALTIYRLHAPYWLGNHGIFEFSLLISSSSFCSPEARRSKSCLRSAMEGRNEALHSALADLRERLHARLEVEVKMLEERLKQEVLGKAEKLQIVNEQNENKNQIIDVGHRASPSPVSPVAPTFSLSMKVADGDRENQMEVIGEDSQDAMKRPPNDAHKAMLYRSDSYERAQKRAARPNFQTKVNTAMSTYEFRYGTWKDVLFTVAHSPFFDLFWALVITSNAIYLGVTLSVASQDGVLAVHFVYAVLFALELLMRVAAVGCREYLFGSGWAWNLMDVVVVSASWLDIILDLVGTTGGESVGSSFRVLRLLRVSRLLRIVKTLWIVRFVGALRTLVSSLVDTFKPLFWAMLLLMLIIYIAGVLFTDVALQHYREVGHSDHHSEMMKFFGSLGLSVQTLFKSISGGFDWSEAADALKPLGDFWVFLFHCYIVTWRLSVELRRDQCESFQNYKLEGGAYRFQTLVSYSA